MNGDWWKRQFGDEDSFALSIALGRDPHPRGAPEIDSGWGGMALWVNGRCLTRNISREAGPCDEIRWNLESILLWLLRVGPRLVNEEPFPFPADGCRDACSWIDRTEDAPQVLSSDLESEWFSKRSEWRSHHALRRAACDLALPNVVVRRSGGSLEVSWDNETWGTTRPGLDFVERRGTELVNGAHAARVLNEAVREVTRAVAEHDNVASWTALANEAARSRADQHDWRWLVPVETAHTIQTDLQDLDERLREHTRTHADGWFVPHTPETLALRHVSTASASELQLVLEFVRRESRVPMSTTLRNLVTPTPPRRDRPWRQGYDRALEVRDELGWGDGPAPDLAQWLHDQGVTVEATELARSIDLLVLRSQEDETAWAAAMALNPEANSGLRREIASAAALGHLLMDPEDDERRLAVAIEGAREDWPSAARARAFGVMLLLPTDGVREVLRGKSKIDARDIARVMERFGTGPIATTYHLMNLHFFDEERRVEILRELAA